MKYRFRKTVGVYDRPEGGSGTRNAAILLAIAVVVLVGVLILT
jgi:hypothetical protein